MPIYEYRCDSCGFQKEYIQRMSDALLTDCPECKKATFSKMVTAAGFQLKGGGWYVTDFKGGNSAASAKKTDDKQKDGSGAAESAKSDKGASDTSSPSTASSPAASTSPAPAASSGS